MINWIELIEQEMQERHDSWDEAVELHLEGEIVSRSLIKSHPHMTKEFHDGFGSSEGVVFTLFTERHVYFPAVYDGSEWVASVPRNPPEQPTPTCHVGGQ